MDEIAVARLAAFFHRIGRLWRWNSSLRGADGCATYMVAAVCLDNKLRYSGRRADCSSLSFGRRRPSGVASRDGPASISNGHHDKCRSSNRLGVRQDSRPMCGRQTNIAACHCLNCIHTHRIDRIARMGDEQSILKRGQKIWGHPPQRDRMGGLGRLGARQTARFCL